MTGGGGPLPRQAPPLTAVFLGVLAVGLLVAWLVGDRSDDVARVDRPAPAFTVELIDGGEFDLVDHLATGSGAVVVNLWASWCIPCRTEIPEISVFARAHTEVTVVGVSVMDSEGPARAFAAQIGAAYPLALGNPAFENAYPWLGLPATYVIDANGTVRVIHNGIVDAATLEEMTEDL